MAGRTTLINRGLPSTVSQDEQDRTLWMGDMEPYMNADFLAESFHRMGEEIKAIKVVYDKYSGRPAGYCFIEMSDPDAARRAMLNVNGKVIPKSRPPVVFNLSFSTNASAPYTEYNVMVMNLPPEIDDNGLFMLFGERYRSCKGAKVMRHPDGASKCSGTVRFADAHDQQAAVRDMTGTSVLGKHLILRVAAPRYRGPRQAFFASAAYDPSQYYNQHKDYYASGQWEVHDQRSQMQLMQQQIQQQQTHAQQYEREQMAQVGLEMPPLPAVDIRSMPSALGETQLAHGAKKPDDQNSNGPSFFDARSHTESVLSACGGSESTAERIRGAMLDAREETDLCQLVAETGLKFAKSFQPPMWPCVCWSALNYFRRFFTRRSNMEYSGRQVIIACFYVAAKVDEFNVTIDEFVANLKTGNKAQNTEQILTMEPVVMAEIDYDLLVHNPLRPFEGHMVALKTRCAQIGEVESLRPASEHFMNMCLLSDAPLLYAPTQIALAALFYAARCAQPTRSMTPYLNELYGNDQEKVKQLKQCIEAIISIVTSTSVIEQERAAQLQKRAREWGDARLQLEELVQNSAAVGTDELVKPTSEWDDDSD